ncbi:hypothetical protein FTO74_18565 [Granulicella sp. WH15]|uniref:hypothetical protein n=1 Tax=Granulicella sp. WH15 TaxID=2602070 RepID=UPI0013677CFA|nr:hypothetical protein [Granulicella sp. WH15]QHN05126.1 hypothetical protein FTO74_18565 [Granulicella sp. WH15]
MLALQRLIFSCLSLCVLGVALSGCSGNSNSTPTPTTPTPTNNPSPTVTSLSPASVSAGAAAQTLTITGTGFVSTSTVTFKGASHSATYVSATSITLSLTTADQATAGSFPVVVTNPTPGGGASKAVNLAVNNPAPTVTSISPSTVSAGSGATTVTVTGTGFVSGSTVTFAGAAVTPTIVSGTSLTIPLTAANLAAAGTFPIVVTNPAPGGGASTAINLTVTASISGLVYKGASVGSTVTAYAVNSDGTNGSAIGSAKTDADGKFTIALSSTPTGAVRVTAAGGNYVSEFDGTTITGTSNVSAILDSIGGSVTGLVITPASDFINSYTAGQLSSKKTTSEVTAHSTAEALIRSYVGLSSKAVIESLVPVFDKPSITSNPDGFTLGLFIGALAALGHTDVPSSPDDIIAALSADISDGVFDGKVFGTPIPLSGAAAGAAVRMKAVALASTAPTTLSPTAGTSDMLLALGIYISSGTAIKNAGILPGDVVNLESSFFTGVTSCTCTPASSGLLASSSGAMTTYSLAGRQYLIVAARQQGVVVIDITDPTLKAPPINAWPVVSSKTFSGSDVGGVIAITGLAGHPQVLAYAYQSKTIAVLNLNTLITGNPATDNPVDITTSLTLKASSPVGFSGGSAYIAGGIPDTGRLGVWLDTADGYGLLPLTALASASTTSPVALTLPFTVDSTQEIAENMGGDVTNSQLLGGNYRGIYLMELAKGKSYYMSSSAVQTVATRFSGDLIDGNSVDSALRVGILTSEDTPAATFLNLKTAVETDPSPATAALGTLAPASGGLVQVVLGSGYSPVLSGSAVDKSSHLVLFMAGYSNDFAVGKLQDPASVAAGATWEGMSDWSYFTINNASTAPLSSYEYATDPHSVGVVVNQTTGTPYGYLFDGASDRGVVQIDMTNFLALSRKGTTGDGAHQPGVDPSTATTTVGGKSGLVLQEFTWTNPTAPIAAIKHTVTQEEFPNQPMLKPQPK